MYNYRIGEIMGIPIRLNISFVIFLPILAWLLSRPEQIGVYIGLIDALAPQPIDPAPLEEGYRPTIIGAVAAIGLFASVLLHELGHSWMARRYDIPISSITLWIFGGVASLERLPREWNREFWIAIAGPVVSVLLGLFCYVAMIATPSALPMVVFLTGWLAVTNLVLAAFNMLPAFPMDGGRILRALLARNHPYVDATRTAARVGQWMALFLAIVGVFANVFLILIALFVYVAATSESRMVALDDLLSGVTAADLMSDDLRTVPAETSVDDLLSRMFRERRTGYPVVDGRGSIVGLVSLASLKSVRDVERAALRVEDVMSRDVQTISPDLPAFEVLQTLGGSDAGRLIVAVDGEPVGSITREDFGAALEVLRRVGTAQPAPEWVDGVR